MVILQSYFPSCKITVHTKTVVLQTALKITDSNWFCKITLVWLDSSLSVAEPNSLLI